MILNQKRTRRHKNDYSDESDINEFSNNNQNDEVTHDKDNSNSFHPDFKINLEKEKTKDLISKKGHFTYYTTKIFSKGVFYFEVEIKSTDFDMMTYIKNKCGNNPMKKKYFEEHLSNISKYIPTIRIGIIKDGNDYEIPIGALKNSYSYRSNDGFLLKEGEYIKGNPTFKTGDIIGCLVHLKPPKPKFLLGMENEMPDLDEECCMEFYKNGKLLNEKIMGIKEGDYHFGITLYNFAEAKIIFDTNCMKYIPNSVEINPI